MIVIPFTKVKMSVQDPEEEVAVDLEEASSSTDAQAHRLDPEKAMDIYKTVGTGYKEIAVEPRRALAVRRR